MNVVMTDKAALTDKAFVNIQRAVIYRFKNSHLS